MGHASSSYLIQVSEFGGTYSNPYKQGGKGIKYTPWKTIDGRSLLNAGANLSEVKKAWLEYNSKKDPAKITRYRVTYKGKTIIDHQGRVYEEYTQPGTGDTWMRFVEELI